MGHSSRQKSQNRDLRETLRQSAGKNPIFVLTLNEKPTLLPYQVGGQTVRAAFAFKSINAAIQMSQTLSNPEHELGTYEMPLVGYLGGVCNHLLEDDIDVLVTDDGKIYPLTTLGVESLASTDPSWKDLLEKSRVDSPKWRNFVLLRVLREVLGFVADDPLLFHSQAQCTDEDITRLIMGKRGNLPGVDLGLVWALSQDNEFLFLNLQAPEDGSEPALLIGPMVFSDRFKAMNYDDILPETVALKISNLQPQIQALHCHKFLQLMANGFQGHLPQPEPGPLDALILDGGCLPLSAAGAAYTEGTIERPKDSEPPKSTWVSFCAEKGVDQMQKGALALAARTLGVQITLEQQSA